MVGAPWTFVTSARRTLTPAPAVDEHRAQNRERARAQPGGARVADGRRLEQEALSSGSESKIGAGDRTRTGDPLLGRQMLYQLSYPRSTRI